MKFVAKSALLTLIFFAANLLHAQETGTTAMIPSSPANLPLLESYSDAQLEQVLNDLAAMPLIWPTNLSNNGADGTYWSLAHPNWPPMPTPSGTPFWNLSAHSASAMSADSTASDASADSTASTGSDFYLLDDVEYPPIPDGATNGGYFPALSGGTPINTNVLWIQITNISNGTVFANLNHATDFVYQIFSLTNLSMATAVSNWNTEAEVFPNNTNVMPFTVSMNGRNPLFLWARDWTGITTDGNQTPSWWFYDWFGSDGLDLSDTNLDSSGQNTLLYDFQNDIAPNVIQFSISLTNQYVNSTNIPIQIDIGSGEPFYMAVLIDSTNFADAVWNAYTSSNIIVNPISLQGWHNVYVGLRGFSANATQTWQWQHLDFVSAPFLVITNPISSVVDEPILQIYGYAQEQLANITYDISNASSIITNEPSFITDEYFDTNQLGVTTNYFECLDVPLTNGLNVVTMRATDLAGDTTVSNFDFTLDYSSKTNPPVVQFTWPQPGTQISGTNCMFTGWISDPTAVLTTQVIVTNANFTNLFSNGVYTNVYTASIDRAGNFTMANLPLNPGANTFSITALDAAGNIWTTNLSVVQTNFVLTMNPLSPISQPTVGVSGNISDSTYAVWVNGVKGANNGNGTWSANNVPATNGNFTVTAYGPNEQQPDGSYGN